MPRPAYTRKKTRTPDTTSPEHDWRHDAECRTEDPELFFPIGDSAAARLQTEEAKTVCYRCPAMEACGQWALKTGQIHGVWGGLDENERQSLTRRHARARVREAS